MLQLSEVYLMLIHPQHWLFHEYFTPQPGHVVFSTNVSSESSCTGKLELIIPLYEHPRFQKAV